MGERVDTCPFLQPAKKYNQYKTVRGAVKELLKYLLGS